VTWVVAWQFKHWSEQPDPPDRFGLSQYDDEKACQRACDSLNDRFPHLHHFPEQVDQ
jgi:hypothetical protein